MPDPEIPDDATEIVDARLRRVDLVKSPASGMPFFIAKSAHEGADVPDDVTKSDAEDALDGAVAAPKLGDERPVTAPGDPDDPTSAAWEAVDAANGRAAVNALVALKSIVGGLLGRETVEDFTGTDDDACENTYDLDSVLSALDFALGVLAPFAVTEQAEADERAEDALVKATANVVQIVKAGRVLSSANEAAIRGAVDSLTKVLDSLPTAKEADVTKADETVETDVTKAGDTPTEDVAKADDLSTMSEADLKRLAITGEDSQRTAALTEIGLRALSGDMGADAGDSDKTDETDDAAEVDAGDAGTQTDTADAADVTKSDTETPVDVVKAIDDLKTEHASVVKSLQDRITALEVSPAPSRVLTNGALPPDAQLRGQGDASTGLARAVEIVKSIEDPDARQEAFHQLLKGRV
jgi:hypothetical protein